MNAKPGLLLTSCGLLILPAAGAIGLGLVATGFVCLALALFTPKP